MYRLFMWLWAADNGAKDGSNADVIQVEKDVDIKIMQEKSSPDSQPFDCQLRSPGGPITAPHRDLRGE